MGLELQEFRDKFKEAMVKELTAFKPEQIREQLVRELRAQQQRVVFELLGLSDHWGKVELNARNGVNTPANEFMKKYAAEAVEEFGKKYIVPAIEEIKFSAKAKKELRADINRRVRDNVSMHMYEFAEHAAHEIVKELVEDTLTEIRTELGLPIPEKKK